MIALGVILCRAGSKGLPDKCVRDLLGRAVIDYTLCHAFASRSLSDIVLSTDSEPAKQRARSRGVAVVGRPAELAHDTATVDAAARHAVESWEREQGKVADAVVLLYGNIPVRAEGLIDRAVEELRRTGADSVRSVARVSKQHPDWIHRVDAAGRMTQFRPNSIYRRQDLEPLYYHDGAVAVVTRKALFDALNTPDDHQSFLGTDRRALIQSAEDSVDIDEPIDLCVAEAVLRSRAAKGGMDDSCADWMSTVVAIGSRRVGRGCSVYVVAEAGVNHNGDVDTALRLVDAAVEAGADAVKFQMFRAADLATESAPTATYQKKVEPAGGQRRMLEKLELSDAEFRRVREHCRSREIDFLATPFGVGDVERLAVLHPVAVKIASTDLCNLPLLSAAAETGLSLIVSTGASTETEIQDAVLHLRRHGAGRRLVLLHCVSAYPAPLNLLNLGAIETLERSFQVPVGFSDHSTAIQTGAMAVIAGAAVVEKHFTLNREDEGPDHAMSLAPHELADYIAGVRMAEIALGSGRVGMTAAEAEVRNVAGKSVVSAAFIPAGTRITKDMLAVKRPGGGVLPADLSRVVGRVSAVDIPADALISWDMVPD